MTNMRRLATRLISPKNLHHLLFNKVMREERTDHVIKLVVENGSFSASPRTVLISSKPFDSSLIDSAERSFNSSPTPRRLRSFPWPRQP